MIVPGEGPLNVFLADQGVSRIDDVPVIDSLAVGLAMCEVRARMYRDSACFRRGTGSSSRPRRPRPSTPPGDGTSAPADARAVTADADVIVVGAGAAGMMTALRAARRGRQVLVFESSTRHGCNTQFSSGSLAAGGTPSSSAGVDDSPERHAADILAVSGDTEAAARCARGVRGRPAVRRLAHRRARAPARTRSRHAPRRAVGTPPAHRSGARRRAGPRAHAARGPGEYADITFVDNTPVVGLLVDGGRVTGSGCANPAASRRHRPRGGAGQRRLRQQPGVVATLLPRCRNAFYGGVSTSRAPPSCGAPTSAPGCATCPATSATAGRRRPRHPAEPEPALPGCAARRPNGARFCDETAQGYSKLAGILRGLPGEGRTDLGRAGDIAMHAELMRESAAAKAYRRYDTLGELAAGLSSPRPGCDPQRLPRGLNAGPATGRGCAPWYAAWITHGILATQGGLPIDPAGRVLHPDGTAIPGLSAAGGAATGISEHRRTATARATGYSRHWVSAGSSVTA